MAHKFWRSEIVIVWFQYLAAGASMIPAGIVYVFLIGRLGEPKAFSIALGLAVAVSLPVWACVGRLLKPSSAQVSLSRSQAAGFSNQRVEVVYVHAVWIGSEATTGPYAGARTVNSLY